MIRGLPGSAWALGLLMLSTTAVAQGTIQDLGHRVLNNEQDPLRYHLDARASQPAGNTLDQVEGATLAAFQAWQNVDCAWPAFQFVGRATTGSPTADVADPTDRFTVVPIWVTSASDPRYRDTLNGSDLPAAARPLTFGGYVYQCDIYLNAVDYRWSTLAATPPDAMDLRTVLMREVGHCLGLGDTYDFDHGSAVMYAVLKPGESRRQLAAYDTQALCQFYPQAGAVGSPCPSGTCSNRLTCVTVPSTTTRNDVRVCARGCSGTTAGECPAPYVCRDSTLVPGFTKACLPALPDALTPVGSACDGSAGSCVTANARCIPPSSLPSGPASGFDRWDDGYCTESCNGPGTCPGGAECADVEGQGRVCLKRCAGAADCRPGYTCAPRPEGNLCVPACYGDVDCGGGTTSLCRLCDRVCVAPGAAGRQVGDACTADSQCGTNQYCLKPNGNSQGVCAQPCAPQSCACPGGTTCRVISAAGEQACVRDCSQGTCASPLQCSAVESGAACLPACQSTQDCPPNMLCGGGGACYDPSVSPDAGTCALCGDAGTPPPPPSTDGGTGGSVGGPDGCGCQGAPVSAAAFLGGLVGLLWVAGRRRTWHRQ